jgi:hypothetical protein
VGQVGHGLRDVADDRRQDRTAQVAIRLSMSSSAAARSSVTVSYERCAGFLPLFTVLCGHVGASPSGSADPLAGRGGGSAESPAMLWVVAPVGSLPAGSAGRLANADVSRWEWPVTHQ